jgi:hypothetical protein
MNSATISQGHGTSSAHLFSATSRASVMAEVTPVVFVVDDDVSALESLRLLAECKGWRPREFASVQEFFAWPPGSRSELPDPGCYPRGPRWSRRAKTHLCRTPRNTDHLCYRTRRSTHHGRGDEGRGIRILNEAVPRRRDGQCHPRGRRTPSCCPRTSGEVEYASGLLRIALTPRTAGYGAGGIRLVKQTGGRGTRHQ